MTYTAEDHETVVEPAAATGGQQPCISSMAQPILLRVETVKDLLQESIFKNVHRYKRSASERSETSMRSVMFHQRSFVQSGDQR